MSSQAMKELIYPLVSHIPLLLEYIYSAEEVADVDKFQVKKIEYFKRMVLECLKPNDGVGFTVPLGYDDIMV
jgi:hypothetical protein